MDNEVQSFKKYKFEKFMRKQKQQMKYMIMDLLVKSLRTE